MKKAITILMIFTLLCICGCGSNANTNTLSQASDTEVETIQEVSESQPKEKSISEKLAEINGSPINGEWTDDEYGHLTASLTFDESGSPAANYMEYTAATDDPENLIRVCTAMNAFIMLNERDGKAKKDEVYRSALPGDNSASLFSMMAIISGTELDGTETNGVPSWYNEYNGTDEAFLEWLLNCYGECIDELNARTDQINQLIEESK